MTTPQTESVDFADIGPEMEQMRQFIEGSTAPMDTKPKPETEVETPPTPPEEVSEEDLDDEDIEGEEGAEEEAEGEEEPEIEEGEAEPAAEIETPQPEATAPDPREVELERQRLEIDQQKEALRRQQREAQTEARKRQMDQAEAATVQDLVSQYGMEEEGAKALAAQMREQADREYAVRDGAEQFQHYIRLAVQTANRLGRIHGVDPDVIFPPNAEKLPTFAEMKATAERLGRETELVRENEKLKRDRVPPQQFARTRGQTGGARSHAQLVESASSKPFNERTPAEQRALEREARGA